jgi:hypothetical protein
VLATAARAADVPVYLGGVGTASAMVADRTIVAIQVQSCLNAADVLSFA